MEEFVKPSAIRKTTPASGARVAVAIAVSIPLAVALASWLNAHVGSGIGDLGLAIASAAWVLAYSALFLSRLDEVGRHLFLRASSFNLSWLMALGVSILVGWKVPAVQTLVLSHGFELFFGAAAAGQLVGYSLARLAMR